MFRNHQQSGMTLVEVMVAIGTFSMMMVAVTALFATLWKSQQFSMSMSTASLQSSRVTALIADDVRNARQADNGAYPIVSVSDNEIVFFGNVDADAATERIRLWRDGSQMWRGVIEPQGVAPVTYPTATEIVATVGLDVVDNPDSAPLFIYYDTDNNLLSAPLVASEVRMVQINVSMDTDIAKPPAASTVSAFASIRNLRTW